MATSATDYAGGAVTVLVAAARFGADCVHAGAHGTGPHGDLIRAALEGEGIGVSAPPVADLDTGICVVMVEPSAERTFVTTLGAERHISVDSLATSRPAGRRPGLRHRLLAGPRTHARPPAGVAADARPRRGRRTGSGGGVRRRCPHVRAAMLEVTDVWSSNAEEAEDILRAVGAGADPNDLAELTTAIAPLLRGDAVAIVRDGPEGCAVHVAGETTYVPGFPAEAGRHQRRGRHPHGCAAGRGRSRYAVGGGLPSRQRGGRDQGHPARARVGAPTGGRGRRVPGPPGRLSPPRASPHADTDRPGRPAVDPEFLVVVLDALTLAFLASLSRTS